MSITTTESNITAPTLLLQGTHATYAYRRLGGGIRRPLLCLHHRRAQLVVLTDKGRQTFDAAMRLQAPWINSLSDGLAVKDIETVHRVIAALRKKLEGNDESEERA